MSIFRPGKSNTNIGKPVTGKPARRRSFFTEGEQFIIDNRIGTGMKNPVDPSTIRRPGPSFGGTESPGFFARQQDEEMQRRRRVGVFGPGVERGMPSGRSRLLGY